MWRGWASADHGEDIASHLREVAAARFESAAGHVSTSVLLRPIAGGVELVTFGLWETADALPADGVEDHPLLVARQTIADRWEVVSTPDVVARAA
jgi:hypothetical protein